MDNITILLLSVVSQWVVKTESLSSNEYSHLVLIAAQRVRDNISFMFLVIFFGWVIVSYHCLLLPGSHYNLCVSYLDNISV